MTPSTQIIWLSVFYFSEILFFHFFQSAIESLFGASLTGIAYSLFAGQPLTILGSTGPVLVFEKILFKFCKYDTLLNCDVTIQTMNRMTPWSVLNEHGIILDLNSRLFDQLTL